MGEGAGGGQRASLVQELRDEGVEVLPLHGDLSDSQVPAALVEQGVRFCGGELDALVSNAGLACPLRCWTCRWRAGTR